MFKYSDFSHSCQCLSLSVKIVAVPMAVVSRCGCDFVSLVANNDSAFLFLMNKLTFVAAPGLRCCLGFSPAAAISGCSSSRCVNFCGSGFSCCRAVSSLPSGAAERGLRSRVSGWRSGPVALRHVGSSWPRDPTCVSCPGRQAPHHWATWEALKIWKVKCNKSLYSPHVLMLLIS